LQSLSDAQVTFEEVQHAALLVSSEVKKRNCQSVKSRNAVTQHAWQDPMRSMSIQNTTPASKYFDAGVGG
jgi:hypothetical protein